LALDFDGVMTDDGVYVTEDGCEFVRCSRSDGMGLSLLRAAGFPVVVISKETNAVVGARCKKLKIPCVQACDDKLPVLERIAAENSALMTEVIYVGNDVNDISCLRAVGCGLAVPDAHPYALQAATAILRSRGGHGAVREICDLILRRLADTSRVRSRRGAARRRTT
jgi:N-acylneuraminate cytidylyltransferase